MSTTGVTYYKLENGYPGDVTKGCGLSGSEIDKNFHFLRGYDIKEGEILSSGGTIVFTRVNGDEMRVTGLKEYVASVVNGKEEVQINEEDSYFDKDRYELHIALNYADGTTTDFVIGGFLVDRDRIYVGEGLYGNGKIDNPLRTNPVNDTGFFKAVKEFIDFSGATEEVGLPTDAERGDRYLTREKTTKYGLKYNTAALNDIMRRLAAVNGGWRVPTADDWNGMLNAYEDCDWREHGESLDSGYYGKDAGTVLKDESWPDNDPEQKVGFKILPTDLDDNGRMTTSFWSSTTDKIREITSKTFRENNGRVYQKGRDDQESTYAYVRFVRDFDEGAYKAVEVIDGVPYDCVVLSSVTSNGIWSTKIWTVQNAYFSKYFINGDPDGMNALKAELDNGIDDGEEWFYYINEWDGTEWLKRRLEVNDCLVIEKFDGQPDNSEYILTEDGIENRTDKIIGDVFSGITGEIERLDERIDNVEDALSAETAQREEDVENLWEAVSAVTEVLNNTIDGLDEEAEARIAADEAEKEARIAADEAEKEARIDNDIDFTKDYVMEVVGGVDLFKVNGDSVNIAFDGNFAKYPNGVEGEWTLS